MAKKEEIFAIALVILVLIFIFYNSFEKKEDVCGDKTLFGECSTNKPYFCENGVLVEKASICGCPEILTGQGDFCASQYQENPKEISLSYILRGQENTIDFTIYEGMVGYLSNLPTSIRYTENQTPSRADFKLRNINEDEQRELLLPLVIRIQNLADEGGEQARIAISLVQNIPYEQSNKSVSLTTSQTTNYSRYPYEVLYDQHGICGEKTELLAFLLKELGYGTAFFYHAEENHESVGIKCPEKYSLAETGYCFVETTGPSIITDTSIEYVGGITLESEPELYLISEGGALPKNMYEYDDAKDMKKIRWGGFLLFKESKLQELKGKYGLVEEYNLE